MSPSVVVSCCIAARSGERIVDPIRCFDEKNLAASWMWTEADGLDLHKPGTGNGEECTTEKTYNLPRELSARIAAVVCGVAFGLGLAGIERPRRRQVAVGAAGERAVSC